MLNKEKANGNAYNEKVSIWLVVMHISFLRFRLHDCLIWLNSSLIPAATESLNMDIIDVV